MDERTKRRLSFFLDGGQQCAFRTEIWAYEPFGDIPYTLVASAPLVDGGRVVGTISLGYSMVDGMLTEQVRDKYESECTIFQKDVRVATTLVDQGGKNLVGTRLENGKITDMVLRHGQTYTGQNVISGKKYVTIYFPLSNIKNDISGMMFVAKPFSIEIILQVSPVLISLACVLALILSLLCSLFVRWLMNRIKNISDSLTEIATGDADLTKRCKLFVRDEIGSLEIHFNLFVDKLQNIVGEIKGTEDDLLSYGDRLKTMVQENTTFVDSMAENIHNVETEIENQNSLIKDSTDSVGAISTSVQQLARFL